MNIATIIPAAGRGTRMLSLTDNCPKSMIPVSSRPLISYLLDQIIEQGQKDVYIIVGYKKEVLMEYVDMMYASKLNITYVEQKELLGLGHAIHSAMSVIDVNKYDGIFIMLGDSIFKDNSIYRFGDKSYIACMQVQDYSRWCIASVNNNNEVIGFFDKPETEPDNKLALVGAYYFSNPSRFKWAVEEAIKSKITIRGEYQISTAMDNYLIHESIYSLVIDKSCWFDFGDLTTYNNNKKLFNQSRYFNNIEYKNNLVTKRSSNYHKLQQEIMWYITMPKQLDKYIATLKEYSLNDADVYYSMPYCDGVTLQELWLYSNLSNEEWLKIFDNINALLTDFEECSNKEHKVDFLKFLCSNLIKRVPNLRDLLNNEKKCTVNNKELRPMSEVNEYFYTKLNNLESAEFSRIIHGDMVFSNIIYDIATGNISLIDPRGNFNDDIIYGDVRYDLAKLMQCVVGDYDFIVNNLFTINMEDDIINYSIYNTKSDEDKKQLINHIIKQFNVSYSDILFITAIQFLTMIPLHAENEQHQLMMGVKFMELLNEAYNIDNK